MELANIIAELKAERDRLTAAINALEGAAESSGTAGRKVRIAGAPPRRRRMSAQTRKRLSQMMKKRWAERKKAAKGRAAA